jgi:hypothetical protein
MQAFQSGSDLLVLKDGNVHKTCYKAEIILKRYSELHHIKLWPAVQTYNIEDVRQEVQRPWPQKLTITVWVTYVYSLILDMHQMDKDSNWHLNVI